jgi:hypothetical protein
MKFAIVARWMVLGGAVLLGCSSLPRACRELISHDADDAG